ncbi:efflux RND transporter periplasmic adaptor subunit [Granulicella sp. S190]|uniref:efflux RND transporter periplasmic adaptor subunit n=1 Tax=Granulicella sp. S190 TaxID=1747226 RepID=UPI0020B142DF|nr:efflux RND transporter periplasmic adaptor subunit [Granulicella sp. S190]
MPTTETRRLNPAMLWGIFLAVIAVIFVIVRSSTRDLIDIRVAVVDHQNIVSSVSTNGKVEPIEEFPAYAPAPGVVAKVYVDVGQKVKEGQLLLKMDDADAVAKIAAANAAVHNAQATLHDVGQGGSQDERIGFTGDLSRAQQQQEQAAKDLAALQALQQKGAASASEVASAQQRLQTADNALKGFQSRSTQRFGATDRARAEAQLGDARASLAAAQANYANDNIRAPFAGTVYSIPVSNYDFVPAGENLLDLADLNKIQVRAYFDEPEIGKLAAGQAVKIVWDAKPTQTWHGHINRAPTTVITYGTRNVGECIITVDDARGDLLPNTNVVVTVTTSQRFNVLSVPREALHTEGGDFVFRVLNNKLVRTPVQVGVGVNLTRVEIISGLSEKDTVALSAVNNRELTNGLPVKIVE